MSVRFRVSKKRSRWGDPFWGSSLGQSALGSSLGQSASGHRSFGIYPFRAVGRSIAGAIRPGILALDTAWEHHQGFYRPGDQTSAVPCHIHVWPATIAGVIRPGIRGKLYSVLLSSLGQTVLGSWVVHCAVANSPSFRLCAIDGDMTTDVRRGHSLPHQSSHKCNQ